VAPHDGDHDGTAAGLNVPHIWTSGREWIARLWGTLSGRRADRELEHELRLHLEFAAAEEASRNDLAPDEARRAAAIRLGGMTQSLEALRDQRGLPWLDDVIRDVRHTLRSLRRSPAFTVVAVLILALGVGANTALFGIVDTVLLKPLPVRSPESLVGIELRSRGEALLHLSYPLLSELRDRNHTLAAVVASMSDRMETRIPPSSDPESVRVSMVSGNLFEALGVAATIGRTLTAADDRPSAAQAVAVLSDRFWRNRFHADPAAIGAVLEIQRVPVTVIGIAAPGFFGTVVGELPDVWIPAALQPQILPPLNYLERAGVDWLRVVARLGPGVSRAQAEGDLNLVLQQVRRDWTGTPNGRGLPEEAAVVVASASNGVSEQLRQRFSRPLQILMIIAGLVLVLGCVNLANLLLARASARAPEIATRAAIGASRTRLVRQLAVEHGVLALLGGAVGLLLARWSTGPLLRMLADETGSPPVLLPVDRRVLMFAALACVVSGLIFGIVPALQMLRNGEAPRPRELTRTVRGRFGKSLVVVQIARSLVLVIAAALFVRTVQKLRYVDTGFQRGHVLLAQVDPRATGARGAELIALFRRIHDELDALPGVRSVSYSGVGLMQGRSRTCCFGVTGYTPAEGERMAVRTNDVSSGYFANVGMTILEGRSFDDRDGGSALQTVIVNDAFVKQYLHSGSALGRSFWFDPAKPMEIVGVVRGARFDAVREPAVPMVFLPIHGVSQPTSVEVRADGDPAHLIPAVRRSIAAVHPRLRVREVTTVDRILDASFAQESLLAKAAGLFGSLAMAIACLGTYGLMVFLIARRTREIGLRMALGARRTVILADVCRESASLVLGGLVVGVPLALVGAHLLRSQLFGVEPTDPLSIVGAGAVIGTLALLACVLPARRAIRVQPLIALRTE
jgi:predicted permease